MKKRIVALLLCVCIAATMTGCNSSKKGESVNNTEISSGTEKVSFASMKYDASDYVKVGDYKGLELKVDKDYTVADKDVKDYVDNSIIKNYPYYSDSAKTTVAQGDGANIDYKGTVDGKEFDGGSATGYTLQIGSNTFIQGFESGIVGMTVGSEKDLNLKFPDDYSSKDLAGKAVVFHVKVNKIQEKKDMTYDTLTDDYVTYISTKMGAQYKTVADFVAGVKSYLQSSNDSNKQQAIRSAAITKLAETCKVTGMPAGLLDAKVAEVLNQYTTYYCKDGSSLKDYVEKTLKTKYEDFLKEINTEVKSDINTQLTLEAIAEKEKIKLKDDDFASYVKNMVTQNNLKSEDDLYKNYASTPADGKAYLQKVYICNQALQKVVDSAKVSVAASTEKTSPTEAAVGTETSK
jgi:trigger factor